MNINKTRARVMFVDDEPHNLQAFKSAFRREMDVLTATSGQEALQILEQGPVQLIISDQRMPGMSGSEFLAKARELYPSTMRMLLTGYADLEAVIAAVNEGGIYAYATKPWDENDLRLRMEQALEVHRLRNEKERLLFQLQQIFESSGDPIVLVDQRCRIMAANEACARLIGITRDELLATTFLEHLEDPKALMKSLRKARKGNEFVNVDLTLHAKDGRLVDCLMTATYLSNGVGDKPVFQAIIKDITDRKQEEERLRRLNSDLDKRVAVRTAQLVEALEDIGSFSYTVAHDLRSPLKNIAALSEHLKEHAREGGATEDLLEFSDRIGKGTARLIELVDDLLRFSQSNSREVEREEVDLTMLVRKVMEEQVPDDRVSQVELCIEADTHVLADAPMLKVVIHNLLSNALKFSRTIARPHIVIGHRREGDRDHIYVTDNGVGFDAKHSEQAFGAFKRLHNNNQFEGTGVGLAIVQRIVQRHGGEVWAESKVNEGTTIHLALPRSENSQEIPPFLKVA